MPRSQVAANPWHQEEEERDTNHHTQKKQTNEKHTGQLSLSPKQGGCNAKRTEKQKKKMQGKTKYKINYKAIQCKSNTETTLFAKAEYIWVQQDKG